METLTAPTPQFTLIPGLYIDASRWFQRTYGNTYHTVRIKSGGPQGRLLWTSGRCYGYGEQWLQTAWEWLAQNGHAPAEYGGTFGLREKLKGSYHVSDVSRQRDL